MIFYGRAFYHSGLGHGGTTETGKNLFYLFHEPSSPWNLMLFKRNKLLTLKYPHFRPATNTMQAYARFKMFGLETEEKFLCVLPLFHVFAQNACIWLPFMILPIQAALERVPPSLLDASSDLGAHPAMTFRKVILPLAFPGIVAGSIFTFSLTLGDYIIPGIIGSSRLFIGQAVYMHQGIAGNIPLAAAFSVVPIVIMAIYLTVAKRLGAFDAL